MTNDLRPAKTLSRQTIIESKFLTVEHHTVEWPGGRILDQWPWIVGPDAAIVVAVTSDQKFLVFRQIKYAVDGTTMAPVGGMLEAGEEPLAGAKRELREETGYEAKQWTSLGSFHVDPNRGAGVCHLFLAVEAEEVTQPSSDDIEDQQLLFLSHSEMSTALDGGQFKALCWTAAVSLALRHMV